MADFAMLSEELKKLIGAIGVEKEELEGILGGGGDLEKKGKILDALEEASKALADLMAENEITPAEKKRKLAELISEIELTEMSLAVESDFDARMTLKRKLARLKATEGTWKAREAFRFQDLIDQDGNELRELLEEANRDIGSRQNLQRVLKGVEVVLRVGAFGTALAAKMAASAA